MEVQEKTVPKIPSRWSSQAVVGPSQWAASSCILCLLHAVDNKYEITILSFHKKIQNPKP